MSDLKVTEESGSNECLEYKIKKGDIIPDFEELQKHDRRKEEHS